MSANYSICVFDTRLYTVTQPNGYCVFIKVSSKKDEHEAALDDATRNYADRRFRIEVQTPAA